MSNEGIDTMLVIGHDLQTLVFHLMLKWGFEWSRAGELTIGISNAVQIRDSLALAV